MSTTSLRADEVMDRTASLLNDTEKTTYTYDAVLPYLNMAIDELQEELQENNMSPTIQTASYITLTAGQNRITPVESAVVPHYPFDLVEIQKVSERLAGSSDTFIMMRKKDLLNVRPATSSLIEWAWIDQEIRFIDAGATTNREVKLDYVRQPLILAQNENSIIGVINARSYLSFKTASFCARYIGENPTRADSLDGNAGTALDRLLGIGAKGRQATYTRRRPFRSAFKSRGWV